MGGRRVSIRDVAREAGVSVTTVSHALNDKGRLNPETRERVREVAQQLGYRPNPAARSLVSGRTGLIAVLASLPSGVHAEFGDFGYFADLIGGATMVAVSHDVALVVAPTANPVTGDEPFVWDRVPLDGVVVAGPMADEAALPALREGGIPFVTIGRDPVGGESDAVVAADDLAGTRAVLDHLVVAGATRPGLIVLPPLFAVTKDTADGTEHGARTTTSNRLPSRSASRTSSVTEPRRSRAPWIGSSLRARTRSTAPSSSSGWPRSPGWMHAGSPCPATCSSRRRTTLVAPRWLPSR